MTAKIGKNNNLSREDLETKRVELVARINELQADINANAGALQLIDQLEELLKQKESAGKSS